MTDLTDLDIRLYYSSASAGGFNYLGGPRSTEEVSDNYLYNLFQKTTEDEQITGIVKYRCFYVYNKNPAVYIKNPAAYVVSDTESPNDSVAVGWGISEIGNGVFGSTDFSIEQSIANENTAPIDANATEIQFFSGNERVSGAILNNDIPPLKGKACWIKYTSFFNAQDFKFNRFRLRIVADNLISTSTFTTDPNLPPQIMFTVMGNCSSDADFTTLADMMLPTNPHFILTTGNNNTEANPQFFFSKMGPSMAKTMLALGNMDVANATVSNAYLNEMAKYPFVPSPQRSYYSKNIGNIHILVMNTSGQIPYTNPSEQYDFVVSDLRNANTNPSIQWIFVVTNRSTYGSPLSLTQTTGPPRAYYADMATTYHKVFADNGVIAVFQGQWHRYERMAPLKFNPSTPLVPQEQAFDGPDSYTIQGRKNFVDSVIYITVGAGGFTNDHFPVGTFASYSEYLNSFDYGYAKILVDNRFEHPRLIFRYYVTSRNMQAFFEQFSITRTG